VWELRVFLGRDSHGRVRHKSRVFRGGKREAQRALIRLAAQYDPVRSRLADDGGTATIPAWGPELTVNQAIAVWRDNGWEDLSPTTTQRYEQIWRTHIADRLGRRKIASLSAYEVEQFLRQLKHEGAGRGTV
jgi:hypothetical protein